MKNKLLVLSLFLVFSMFLINSSILVSAEDMGGFSIEGVPNDHQLDKSAGYFYLSENPNSNNKIKLKLINSSNSEKVLEVKVVNANTNSNGSIDYTGTIPDNKKLTQPLTSILKVENLYHNVPANSSVEINLNLSTPKNRFNGVIMGGIIVSEKNYKEKNKEKNSISNEYSYTIGVVVTNENKVNLFKNISVKLQSVIAELSAGKKVVQANILNSNPYIFSKAEVKGAVYDEDGKTKIKEHSLNNVSIAPFSALPFQIDWQKDDLKPGTYIFKGSVKTEENTWNFDKKFEIKNIEAKKINEESVFKVVLPIWFIYSGYLVILINIIGSFYIFIRKLRK